MSNLYAGLGSAKLSKRGSFLPHNGMINPSKFKVQFKKFISMNTRKGQAFIVEFDVIESDHPELKPPCEKSQFISMKDKDIAFSNILQLLVAALGYDPRNSEDVAKVAAKAEQLIEYVVETNPTSNPLVGRLAMVETILVKTRAGGDFTAHTWYPITEGQGQVQLGA